MFYIFKNQEERRKIGGSCFLEIQYCKLKKGTPEKEIIAVDSIINWQNDSVYVRDDDFDLFYSNYNSIFVDGLYNNMNHGEIDFYAVNYYSPSQINSILDRLKNQKPPEYQIIEKFLEKAKKFNGFYILGI